MIPKSSIMAFLIIAVIVIAGCQALKPVNTPAKGDDASLVDEIASIEKELSSGKEAAKEEEVVLPRLGDEGEAMIDEEGLQTITTKENQLVSLKASAADPDKDTVTYTYGKPLDANGKWQTTYGDAGEYIVTITATDGELSAEQRVKLVVEKVNVAPVIEALKDLTVKEGEEIVIEPKASDLNNDAVTVTISDPLKSGSWTTDHTSAGEYTIKVTASDGELEAETSFTLTVQDVNIPPVIEGVEDMTVQEGEVVKINPEITDDDGDDVTVTIGDPVGNDGVWETGYTDHGDYTITITADDGKDKIIQKIELTIEDVNKPPVFEKVTLETN